MALAIHDTVFMLLNVVVKWMKSCRL